MVTSYNPIQSIRKVTDTDCWTDRKMSNKTLLVFKTVEHVVFNVVVLCSTFLNFIVWTHKACTQRPQYVHTTMQESALQRPSLFCLWLFYLLQTAAINVLIISHSFRLSHQWLSCHTITRLISSVEAVSMVFLKVKLKSFLIFQ